MQSLRSLSTGALGVDNAHVQEMGDRVGHIKKKKKKKKKKAASAQTLAADRRRLRELVGAFSVAGSDERE